MESMSIHPRVVGGTTRYEKVNTCKPCKDQSKGSLGQRLKNRKRRRDDHAGTIARNPSGAAAYKEPGSMKGC